MVFLFPRLTAIVLFPGGCDDGGAGGEADHAEDKGCYDAAASVYGDQLRREPGGDRQDSVDGPGS